MPVTGNNQLPYPNSSDTPDIPTHIRNLASAVDTAIGGGNRLIDTLADLQAIPTAQCFEHMRATVTSDSTASNNGEYVYTNGAWVLQSRIQAGSVNSSTDPNGYVSVTFPVAMASAPTSMLLTMGPTLNATLASYEELNLGQIDSVHFTVHARNTTNGASMGNNPVAFMWLAIWL